MKRLPLSDEMPYRFRPPALSRFWVALCRPFILRMLRNEQKVAQIEFRELARLEAVLGKGDGILLAINHADHPDAGVAYELAWKLGAPFYYMAAYQIFTGLYGRVLPHLGVYPVDREGADLAAFKASVDILVKANHPLAIFPEGEIYRLSDRITPLREGTAALAIAAVRKLPDPAKTVRIVPIAIKYRYLESEDPLPWLLNLMDNLERRFFWRPRVELSLVERIYRYAEGMLALKEIEHLGAAQPGELKHRLERLRGSILTSLESELLGKLSDEAVPVRVKDLRKACLDRIAQSHGDPVINNQMKCKLEDLFLVMQTFTYPGDYVRELPTRERIAEILLKFEEDALGVDQSAPRSPRRAIVLAGEPIDVRERLSRAEKPRQAAQAITCELQAKLQELLDAIGHGPLIEPEARSAEH